MRRFTLAAALIAALAFSVVNVASAGVVSSNTSFPISISAFVQCNTNTAGEVIDLSGPLHDLVISTINGKQVSGKFQDNPQGVTGTGETTGDSYQGTGITQGVFSGSLVNGQFVYTFVNNFRIIGQGPGNNFMIHENAHLTINANGDVTVAHDNFSVVCK